MLPEATVLDRDDGLLHPGADLLEGDHDAVLVVEGRQQGLAVARVDVRLLRQLDVLEFGGQVLKQLGRAGGGGRRHRGGGQRNACQEEAADDGKRDERHESADELKRGHAPTRARGTKGP